MNEEAEKWRVRFAVLYERIAEMVPHTELLSEFDEHYAESVGPRE